MEEQDVLPPMVGRALIIAALALGLSAQQADAHGAVTIPKPREAIDGDTAPWNGKVPWPIPFGASSPPLLRLLVLSAPPCAVPSCTRRTRWFCCSALPEMYICCVPLPSAAPAPSAPRAHQLTELVRAQTIRTGARTRPPRQRVKIRAT